MFIAMYMRAISMRRRRVYIFAIKMNGKLKMPHLITAKNSYARQTVSRRRLHTIRQVGRMMKMIHTKMRAQSSKFYYASLTAAVAKY